MGYTHYFRGYLLLNEELLEDVKRIIKASGVPIRGWDGTGDPVIDEDEIVLNGDAETDEDHETFSLVNGVNHSNFCKTARKDYDVVVTTILLRASHYSKRFKVESDGYFDPDWDDARVLYARLFGEDAVKPEGITEKYLVRS